MSVIRMNQEKTTVQSVSSQEGLTLGRAGLRRLDLCGSFDHATCNVEREFDAGARALIVATLHYQRGAWNSKKLAEDFRERLDSLITNIDKDATHGTQGYILMTLPGNHSLMLS